MQRTLATYATAATTACMAACTTTIAEIILVADRVAAACTTACTRTVHTAQPATIHTFFVASSTIFGPRATEAALLAAGVAADVAALLADLLSACPAVATPNKSRVRYARQQLHQAQRGRVVQ